MTDALSKNRVYVDLNGIDGSGRVILTVGRATEADLRRLHGAFTEGTAVDFWSDFDLDEAGNLIPLWFSGTLHYDPQQALWVAEVDWESAHTPDGTTFDWSGHIPSSP